MSRIVFFNHFHNGDLHISRGIVSKIIDKVRQIDPTTQFSYAHVNDRGLVSDISNLSFDPISMRTIDQFENLQTRGNATYINTWYAQQHHKYMNRHGMTIDCLYEALDDTCKTHWNFSLSDISSDLSSFYPSIDYSKFYIQNVKDWLVAYPQQKVFVSNGLAMSGQAVNFQMTPIIAELAKRHSEKIFILSNDEGNFPLPSNVFYSKDIIKKQSGSDLNENSFITTFCDLIIGRASGAFSYAWTRQNMIERNTKFLCFCGPGVVVYPPHQFWTRGIFSDKIKYSAEFVVSSEIDANAVKNIIENHL